MVCEQRVANDENLRKQDGPAGFFTKLALGDMPSWLTPLDEPTIKDDGLTMFQVDKNKLPQSQ